VFGRVLNHQRDGGKLQNEKRQHLTTLLPSQNLQRVAFMLHEDALAAVDTLARQAEHSRGAELRQAVRAWVTQRVGGAQ
jgi:hypothetical protein